METNGQSRVSIVSVSDLLASEPKVPDYESKLNRRGLRLKSLESFTHKGPDTIDLTFGSPNIDCFPLAGVKLNFKNGDAVTLDDETVTRIASYGMPKGLPELDAWLLNLQIKEHSPPQATMKDHPSPFGLTIVYGSLAALSASANVLLEEDDTLLTEELVYASILGLLSNYGWRYEGVSTDEQGMIPESLDDLMTNWTQRHPGRPKPKAMYVIPYGNNPTGVNWTEERILQIYLLCRKHDLIVLDDGAYQFLHWGQRTKSLQAIDIDGRVLRFDTVSKTMGAGHRIGWLSGPQALVEKVTLDLMFSYYHPSTLSQAVILGTLKTWGLDGFYREMHKLSEFYRKRGERLMKSAATHLKGLAKYKIPVGGMFLWVEIVGVSDSTPIVEKLHERNLILVPGHFFRPDGCPSNGMRISFGSVAEHKMDKAMELLAQAIREHTTNGSG